MNRFFYIISILFLLVIPPVLAQNLPAFPGAEGFGKYTTGGRGGRVIYVTTLEDNSSPGSLRYAVNQSGPRIVLFKISGTIQLKSILNIVHGDLTIAGQTAPGDGITLRDYTLFVGASNVIIRFLRFRMGDVTQQQNDPIWGRGQKNIIIDHCSMSWGTDECASLYDNENFSLQWCIISESLNNSVHDKGAHGYGGIWGGKKASFHHNLLADNESRNPRFCGSRYSNDASNELVDFRNNVIFNWGSNSSYGAEGGSYNMVNNYYKAGPATSTSKKTRILEAYADNGENQQFAGIFGKFFINGNYVDASSQVTSNNWLGVSLNSTFATYAPGITKGDILSDSEFAKGEITTHSAETAFQNILLYCGASLKRDTVDKRIVNDVKTGNPTYTVGGNGSINGIIDTQDALNGWPELHSEDAPLDTDEDGMPDLWETANNLSFSNANDAQLKTVDGIYPNIEVYINSLVQDIISSQNSDGINTSAYPKNVLPNDIKIYFDNKDEMLVVNHSEKIEEVRIFSIGGQILYMAKFENNNIKVNLSFLKGGIYLILVNDDQKRIFTNKIIKY